jgi:hypothetical protein
MKENNGFLSFVVKHSYIIVILVVLCALGGYAEKKYLNPLLPRTGRITMTQLVKVQLPESKMVLSNNAYEAPDLRSYLGTWSFMQSFIDSTEGRFEYEQFDKNWTKLNTIKKYDWINKHLRVGYLGYNSYEFVLQYQEKDAKSIDYIKEKGKEFLNDYIQFCVSSYSQDVYPIEHVTIGKYYELYEDSDDLSADVPINYAIAGAVLGFFAGLAIVTVFYKIRNHA